MCDPPCQTMTPTFEIVPEKMECSGPSEHSVFIPLWLFKLSAVTSTLSVCFKEKRNSRLQIIVSYSFSLFHFTKTLASLT